MVEVNSQLKQLVKTGDLRDARRMFDKMPHRNEITWTVMISGYVTDLDTTGALVLFSLMWFEPGVRMDPFILSLTAPLDMYSKFGKIEQGCMVFGEMPPGNVVSWTAIITGLVHATYHKRGLLYFFEMRRSGVKMSTPDVVSWIAIISTNVRLRRVENAIRAFLRMRESSVCPNEFTFAAVISGCAGIMRIDSEYNDIMSWTAMINGFAGHGFSYEAIDLFEKLPMVGLEPDSVTFISVLIACSHAGLVELGFHYFNSMSKEYQIGRWREAAIIRMMMKSKGVTKETGCSWIKVKDQVTAFVIGDRSHQESVDIYDILDLLASRGEIAIQRFDSLLDDLED
ncbi:hypothetical protein SLE2022_360830 [Rubroshorea leprosula]